jgi:aminotransferase in exopolysaccharide biosynthesis
MSDLTDRLVDFVRDHYGTKEFIPLHAPVFRGAEQAYVAETISSTFVSSVGEFVNRFEHDIAQFTGSDAAVATVNGTAALHVCLKLAGVGSGDLVLTQALTFVATCNAISYCNAHPVFIDVERSSLGMCPDALAGWLDERAVINDEGACIERESGKRVSACLPMHTFGHPCDLDRLVEVCRKWGIPLVEDAAESLGSYYKGHHTGTFGALSAMSFNGNKIITTGGGGMILSDLETAARAKHLTTTAKKPHAYEYVHDEVGFNYRLPNINAALGVAQMEQLPGFLEEKRALANQYREFFRESEFSFVDEPDGCKSNFWLNAVICPSRDAREFLIKETNGSGIMTRPVWQLMNDLPMYQDCMHDSLTNSRYIAERLVNLPSSVKPE